MAYSLMPPEISYPHRKPQRLPGYDYASPGITFVTLCIQDRLPLLGTVTQGQVQLSPAGRLMTALFEELPDRYPAVSLDTLILMPDHVHALIGIHGAISISEVMHRLKSRSTAQYVLGVREHGWPPFHGKFWQRGFYDRVMRDEEELTRVREYIVSNPARWDVKQQAERG